MINVFAEELERRIDRSCAAKGQIPMPSVETIFEAVHGTMSQVKGAYAVAVLLKGVGIVVFRDPHGIRYRSCPDFRVVLSASA